MNMSFLGMFFMLVICAAVGAFIIETQHRPIEEKMIAVGVGLILIGLLAIGIDNYPAKADPCNIEIEREI